MTDFALPTTDQSASPWATVWCPAVRSQRTTAEVRKSLAGQCAWWPSRALRGRGVKTLAVEFPWCHVHK